MNRQTMKVIGVGLTRTGTKSLANFLDQSGISPAYHGFLSFERIRATNDYTELNFWNQMVDASIDKNDLDWDIALHGCQAHLEYGAKYYKQLANYYNNHDVKFILTIRNDADAWFNSNRNTWVPLFMPRTERQKYIHDRLIENISAFQDGTNFYKKWTYDIYGNGIEFLDGENGLYQKQHCIDVYNKHNESVYEYFTQNDLFKDRFLVLNMDELTDEEKVSVLNSFLKVEQSKKLHAYAYPTVNSTKDFDDYFGDVVISFDEKLMHA